MDYIHLQSEDCAKCHDFTGISQTCTKSEVQHKTVQQPEKKEKTGCLVSSRTALELPICTDGSSFSTAGFGHRPWVIRKADEEYITPTASIKSIALGGRVRCFFLGGGGPSAVQQNSDLIFVPGRVKLDSATYVRMVLGPALVPFGRVARNMDGLSCKRITLQGIKGMPKPAESRTGWRLRNGRLSLEISIQ